MKTPIDYENGLEINLKVTRKKDGKDISLFLGDKHIENQGELRNLVVRLANVLWDSYDLKKI